LKNLSSSHSLPVNLLPIYFTLNSTETIVAVDPLGAASLGYDAEQLIGQSVAKVLDPQDQARLRTTLLRLSAKNPIQEEFCLVGRGGNITHRSVTLQLLQSPNELQILCVCHSLDTLPPHSSPYHRSSVQAEQALHQQIEWEKLMRAVARSHHQAPEMPSVLQAIATKICHQLQADRALFYQISPPNVSHLVAEATLSGCSSILTCAHTLDRLQQQCLQFQALPCNPTSPHLVASSLLSTLDEPWGVRAEAIVSIMQQDKPWGVLVVHRCHQSPPWQLWELGLLKQLAMYLNSVIQQAELYQKEQRLNADLERQIHARTAELQVAFDFEATLKRITDHVRDSLDEHQILETVVQELACTIGTRCCNASIYDLDAGTSTICYEYTTSLSPYQGRVVQLDASPEIYQQLLAGQSFQFCSLNINPMRGKVSMLTCPIIDDQGVLGDLWLINQPYFCFREQDIRLVQQVANQCAIALRQARLYHAAQAQVKELERLNRLKDDFLSTVSHELRTPMANIKMSAQMLEVVLQQAGLLRGNDFKVARYFQILQSECQREINLINNLLDLSRLDTEQLSPQKVTVDLSSWLTAIVQPFLARAQERQQTLQLDLPSELPSLTTDLSSLERIVLELLQNACKYTPAGGTITLTARVVSVSKLSVAEQLEVAMGQAQAARVGPHKMAQSLTLTKPIAEDSIDRASTPSFQLSITNSGIEIPPEELTRVFEKFYRIPNHDPWQHGGTGLGLALVKKLTEWLGGSVWVESGSNQSRFMIELPL
jgi:PAS domain S-box-containing protein